MRIYLLGPMLLLLMLVLLSAQTEFSVRGKFECYQEFTFKIGLQEFESDSWHVIVVNEGTSVNNTAEFAISGNTTNPGHFQTEQQVALVVIHTCNPNNTSETARKFLRGLSFGKKKIVINKFNWDLHLARFEDYYDF
ncbi:hypothetical protein L5515_016555 [Caenorhabditis briggsae]|uniref:Uncharacterized protein n=1 Tax=Caenorhabditis briggsae TaxID=6238 RepID=A0AAE9JRG1_CAEBR|nr:hypothetical protein L5515_016555 [Caenorhabditis briggsae]